MVEFPVIKNFDFFDNNVVALGVDFLLLSGHGKSIRSSSCTFAAENKANPGTVHCKQYDCMRHDGYEYDVGMCGIF